MKERRAAERQKQKHVNEAIKEFLNDSTVLTVACKPLHEIEGNWSEYKSKPLTLLIEYLVGLLRNPVIFNEDREQTLKIFDLFLSIINTLSRDTLTAKVSTAYNIAEFISTHATISNQLFTAKVDRLLSDWLYWLRAYVKGSFEGYHAEFEARLKLIDAWRKMWNLKPIERPPQPQPLNREVTQAEREAAKKRFSEVLRNLEKERVEKEQKKEGKK